MACPRPGVWWSPWKDRLTTHIPCSTKRLARLVHSRGDGLSSPCWACPRPGVISQTITSWLKGHIVLRYMNECFTRQNFVWPRKKRSQVLLSRPYHK
jgi:hypothetical protein